MNLQRKAIQKVSYTPYFSSGMILQSLPVTVPVHCQRAVHVETDILSQHKAEITALQEIYWKGTGFLEKYDYTNLSDIKSYLEILAAK